MPSKPRTNLSSSCITFCLAAVALSCAAAGGAFAASAASADQSSYAGNMLDKITEIWAPPPVLKSDFKVSLKVSVDSQGQVKDCKALKSSGLEAFDNSVCGAVRQIGSFGTPPYGAPIDVQLTFWNGTPKGKPRPEPLSTEEALRAEVKARSKAEAALGDSRAEAAEARARERAEAVARADGKNMPEMRPSPVAPRSTPKVDDNGKKSATTNSWQAAGQTDNGPATQLIGKSKPSAADGKTGSRPAGPSAQGATAAQPQAAVRPQQADTLPSYGEPVEPPSQKIAPPPAPRTSPMPSPKAEAASAPQGKVAAPGASTKATDRNKYRREVTRLLRDGMIIPAETAPGRYESVVRLTISPQGDITDFKVVTPTGDKLLDKYVQRGIRRAGSVPPPPADLGGTLDITLILVRH